MKERSAYKPQARSKPSCMSAYNISYDHFDRPTKKKYALVCTLYFGMSYEESDRGWKLDDAFHSSPGHFLSLFLVDARP